MAQDSPQLRAAALEGLTVTSDTATIYMKLDTGDPLRPPVDVPVNAEQHAQEFPDHVVMITTHREEPLNMHHPVETRTVVSWSCRDCLPIFADNGTAPR